MHSKVSQPFRPWRAVLAAWLLTSVVAGCSTLTTGSGPAADAAARALASRGDHVAASRAYVDLAVDSRGAQQQRYLLLAAGELYEADDLRGAERILERVGDEIDPANAGLWAEVLAEVRLARGRPAAALEALNSISSTDEQTVALSVLLLRSEALFRLDQPTKAVATLVRREALLSAPAAIAENRRLIWKGLQNTGSVIDPVAEDVTTTDPVTAGWLDLGALAYAQRGSINRLYAALDQWRLAHPQHPASELLADEVLTNLRALADYPHQVALLLPFSGPQRAIGQAIRDGYLAAHFDLGDSGERPDIRLYDTTREGAVDAYQRATRDGAAFVVGPLLKEEVSAVSMLSTVTTLALNTAGTGAADNPNVFQFALAPEDEARAVAQRAVADGRLNAVALVPDSDRGLRILTAFQRELQLNGGRLVAARRYNPAETDFSDTLQNALLLNESYARRDRLAANLGKQLPFEPRRRQDIDFIFMAASTQSAKLIKPQLRFHYAGDVPTYATSEVYTPGSTDNRDINGVLFPDIPWLLEPGPTINAHRDTLMQHWGDGAARLGRFYALGYDAYRLSAVLQGRTHSADIEVDGFTGRLRVDASGILHRELRWARMESGVPRTLPAEPELGITKADPQLSERR